MGSVPECLGAKCDEGLFACTPPAKGPQSHSGHVARGYWQVKTTGCKRVNYPPVPGGEPWPVRCSASGLLRRLVARPAEKQSVACPSNVSVVLDLLEGQGVTPSRPGD